MKFLNNKGFSLAQTMVAAGIVGGLALVVTQLSQTSMKTVQHMESKDSEIQFVKDVSMLIGMTESCAQTFNPNLDSLKNGISVDSSYPIEKLYNRNGTVAYEVGKTYQRAFTIHSMDLRTSSELNPDDINSVVLKISLARKKKGYGGRNIIKEVKFNLQTDSDNKILSCFGLTDVITQNVIDQIKAELEAQMLSQVLNSSEFNEYINNLVDERISALVPDTIIPSESVTEEDNFPDVEEPAGGCGSGSTDSYSVGSLGSCAVGFVKDTNGMCRKLCTTNSYLVGQLGVCATGFVKDNTNQCRKLSTTNSYNVGSMGSCYSGFVKDTNDSCRKISTTNSYGVGSMGTCTSGFAKDSNNSCRKVSTTNSYNIGSMGSCYSGFVKDSNNSCRKISTTNSYSVGANGSCISGFVKDASNMCIKV